MIAPLISVLFPSARYVGLWILAAILLIGALMPTPSGFAATNGGILYATAAAALWASDCLRRMRQWDASTLVPNYATTAWAAAVGIVWCVTALATTISSLAGNAAPAFGIATLAGTVLVVAFTFLHKRPAWQSGIAAVIVLGMAVQHADRVAAAIPWHPMTLPASQAAALVLAIVAAGVLRQRLGTPTRPHTDSAMQWQYFRPQVAGPMVLLSFGQAPLRVAETIMLAVTTGLALAAYRPFDNYPTGLVGQIVGLITFFAALTPLMLLRGAAAWLPTAWQLGIGDSRQDLGRSFASKAVIMTLAAFGLAGAIAGVHALLGGQVPSRPGLTNLLDETLLLCTTCLVVFTIACAGRPMRTTKQPSQFGSLGLVCAAFLTVSFTAPAFGLLARTLLLAVVAASAALAIYVGGRLVARFDFPPTNED